MTCGATLAGYLPGSEGHDLVFALMFGAFDCSLDEVRRAEAEIVTSAMAGE